MTYDPQREQYRVDFKFSAPFTAAILDQIDVFTYRRDTFRTQDGGMPTLEEGGQFMRNINVSLKAWNLCLSVACFGTCTSVHHMS